ncbi:cytochrome P450 [Streptomyces sp. Ru73]|uniref:cytochrome P450 family protein n=1 Tax=Streptomyces sp. Ru73 TaxID=2080748 RepID=UPI000CDDE12D|nr:cytochrome P450 [Streptomyces sp. Ru73]POX43478.1 cytochrome P450 [Streptomyces sp. Ru73]
MSAPLYGPVFFQDPYATYARLRSAAPVHALPPPRAGGPVSYLVTGHAAARAALADPRLSKDTARYFADRPTGRRLHPALAHTMLATDPPDHTRLRRLVAPAFTAGAVARLRPYLDELTAGLTRDWRPGDTVDLVAGLAVPLPVTVICHLLGVPEADRAQLRAWSDQLFEAGAPDRIDAASHEVAAYFGRLVAAKRAAPDDGLLSALIAARDGTDRLGEDELVSLAVLILVAGHETTTNLIGNATLALLAHPDAAARLRARPELIPGALDELLRYDSPVGIATFRYATEPLTLAGTDVPAGSPVLVAPGAANRDPVRFADPDTLDLDRDAAGHLAFGHGIHRCLGAPLARAEAATALTALLTRFPALRLAAPTTQLRYRHTRLMRGLEALPVVL